MPITTPNFSPTDHIRDFMNRRIDAVVEALLIVAEKVHNEAVITGTYKDQTRHLRGSIGALVAIDGAVVTSTRFGGDASPEEAKSEGLSYGREVAERYTDGITLVLVAGKNYAVYVQRGYNVLDSAALLAERLVPRMLNQLGFSM